MDQEQFRILIGKLDFFLNEILRKLEQIRWQGIDIETTIENRLEGGMIESQKKGIKEWTPKT